MRYAIALLGACVPRWARLVSATAFVVALGLVLPAVAEALPEAADTYSTPRTAQNLNDVSCVQAVDGASLSAGAWVYFRCYVADMDNWSTTGDGIPKGNYWSNAGTGWVGFQATSANIDSFTAPCTWPGAIFCGDQFSNTAAWEFNDGSGIREFQMYVWRQGGSVLTGGTCMMASDYADSSVSSGAIPSTPGTNWTGNFGGTTPLTRCVSKASFDAGAYPTYHFGTAYSPEPPPPTCEGTGISYETREAVAGAAWEPVVADAWPALGFGDSIRWTMALDAGAQVDLLAFVLIGHTPIVDTGDPPNWSAHQLEPYALDLEDADFVANDGWMSGLGIGLQWPIVPGSNAAQQVGPYTHSGTFLWLGDDGSVPSFRVQCRMYGEPLETLERDGTIDGATTVLSKPACSSYTVIPWSAAGDEDSWGFRFRKAVSTTQFVSLEWRYMSETPTAWQAIYTPASPTAAELEYLFSIDKSEAADPYLIEWRCTANVAGGGTTTATRATDAPAGSSEYGEIGDESCYSAATSGWSLTSPKSWVIGGAKVGVCLVKWLTIPSGSFVSGWASDMQTNARDIFPLSFGMVIVDFYGDITDEMASGTGDTCFTLDLGDGPLAGEHESCAASSAALTGSNRALMALLLIVPSFLGVCAHALNLIRGGSMLPPEFTCGSIPVYSQGRLFK